MLDNLIEKKKEEHGLQDLTVEKGCIRQRLKWNKLFGTTHSGMASPMAPIEEHIVAFNGSNGQNEATLKCF
jgi:hypothetical protein